MTLLSFVNELDIGSKVVHANLIIAYKSIGFVFVYICLKRRSDDLVYYDQSIDIIVKKVVMFKNDLCNDLLLKSNKKYFNIIIRRKCRPLRPQLLLVNIETMVLQ